MRVYKVAQSGFGGGGGVAAGRRRRPDGADFFLPRLKNTRRPPTSARFTQYGIDNWPNFLYVPGRHSEEERTLGSRFFLSLLLMDRWQSPAVESGVSLFLSVARQEGTVAIRQIRKPVADFGERKAFSRLG